METDKQTIQADRQTDSYTVSLIDVSDCSDTEAGCTSALPTAVELPSASPCPCSSKPYFLSSWLASWCACMVRLLRALMRFPQERWQLLEFNHALSIAESWSWGSLNWALILSRAPTFTLSWSPREYHWADTSTTSSSTVPRSLEVSLCTDSAMKSPMLSWNTVQVCTVHR